jgi:hypothetical protein
MIQQIHPRFASLDYMMMIYWESKVWQKALLWVTSAFLDITNQHKIWSKICWAMSYIALKEKVILPILLFNTVMFPSSPFFWMN